MTRARSRSVQLVAGVMASALSAAHAHGASTAAIAPQSAVPLAVTGSLPPAGPAARAGCLPGERGYLQAALRGALQTAIDWRGAALDCQGGTRSGERGVRVSLQGTLPGSGERLRINIGFAAAPGTSAAGAVPASVTVIVEGARRIFSTGDDSHCAVESLQQSPLPAQVDARGANAWRIAARGYCIDPLPLLGAAGTASGDRLYVDRFDFAAIAHFDPEPQHADHDAH